MDPTVLYRIGALPDEIAATLTPDTLLTDPRTGRQVPLQEMSTRSLDRALDALDIRGQKGRLAGDSKQRVLAAIERVRRTVLKWPAWATPVTKKKPAR